MHAGTRGLEVLDKLRRLALRIRLAGDNQEQDLAEWLAGRTDVGGAEAEAPREGAEVVAFPSGDEQAG